MCQPTDLNLEIKNKTGEAKRGAKQKSWGAMAHPAPPLRIATDGIVVTVDATMFRSQEKVNTVDAIAHTGKKYFSPSTKLTETFQKHRGGFQQLSNYSQANLTGKKRTCCISESFIFSKIKHNFSK